MMDIVSIGDDLGLFDTDTARAANILSVQLRTLEYASEIGIDLRYFLSPDFRFQNESFRSYLVQVLANQGINVSQVTELIQALSNKYVFELTPVDNGAGLVAR